MKRAVFAATSLILFACSGSGDGDDDVVNPGLCLNVSGTVTVDGLDIRKPEGEVDGCRGIDGSNPEERLCEQKTPEIECVASPVPFGTSVNVTFTGCVSSFGLDAQSDDLVVTIMNELDGTQATDPGYVYNGTPAMGQSAEKTPGAFIGQVVSTSVGQATCPDEGRFVIENVPTETPLIVRVTDQHQDSAERQYVDTYQYNVVLRNAVVRSGDTPDAPLVPNAVATCTATAAGNCFVVDDVNTVFETTFTTIALTAGVSNIQGSNDLYDGMGQGHVAGEIQDCTSEDTMKNAVVSLSSPAKKIAYFNVDFPPAVANLEDPKVDQSRTRTNADGLYAAIAVDTQDGGQEITIGAAITKDLKGTDNELACNADGTKNMLDDGNGPDIQVLGTRRVFVYPDSITILTFDRQLYTSP